MTASCLLLTPATPPEGAPVSVYSKLEGNLPGGGGAIGLRMILGVLAISLYSRLSLLGQTGMIEGHTFITVRFAESWIFLIMTL